MNLKKTIIIKRSKLEQPLTRGIESLINEDGSTIMFLPKDCTVEYVGEDSKVVFEHRWIPVTERLPEESYDSVIGWDAYRERCVFVQFYNGHFQISGSNESFDIKYWMPMIPSPYEGSETE